MSVLKRQREQKKAERHETKAIRRRERRDGIANDALAGASDTAIEAELHDSELGESPDGSSRDGTE
jgi:hypothetical protein